MTTVIAVEEQIKKRNNALAEANRRRFDESKTFVVNVMASPGAGKTTLILRTIEALKPYFRIAGIDGDLATSLDADRMAATGIHAVQVNTGGTCHLDAVMVQSALEHLDLEAIDLLIIENVGNLVCPASFPLGAHINLLIASVPEGDDKPYKYPKMYRGVQAIALNKVDLLPYFDFDMDYFRQGVEVLNPGLAFFPLSAKTGEGLVEFHYWLREEVRTFLEG